MSARRRLRRCAAPYGSIPTGNSCYTRSVGLDLAARRREFPALATSVHGRRLAYLDSAATALRPRAVIDAIARAAELGNPYRGVHALAEAATATIDDARAEVARLLTELVRAGG